jgi:hypothetical protein
MRPVEPVTIHPSAIGISSTMVLNFIDRLERDKIPIYSMIMSKEKQIFLESYCHPIHQGSLQRLFSVTKSLTGVAILLLAAEDKLNLDDQIADYFPEYLPKDPHQWVKKMTIRDLLTMRTCHQATTYKINPAANWVESFFTTKPSQISGRFFNYDTSASHVLAALVEKRTKMGFLDYLRVTGLTQYGFSKEAYMLKDRFGIPMGGTGLMARARDVLALGHFLQDAQGQLKNYLSEATKLQVATQMSAFHKKHVIGYGYHFWILKEGYVAYGMGGQYLIIFPHLDVVCVITANTQGYSGADQLILNALIEELLPAFNHPSYFFDQEDNQLTQRLQKLKIPELNDLGTISSNFDSGTVYQLAKNSLGFQQVSLTLNSIVGQFRLIKNNDSYEIYFGRGQLIESTFPIYNHRIVASGAWLQDRTFLITCHLIDESVGTIHFQLCFGKGDVVINSRKNEETLYHQFDHLKLYGKRIGDESNSPEIFY